MDSRYRDTSGDGWMVFAAAMLGIAGAWNIIDGILAIGRSHIYGASAQYIFSDLRTWGWIVLILGILQVMAAAALGRFSQWARWFGVAVAGLNAIGQLGFLPAYPFWALSMFAVDVFIIYALTVYGGVRVRA
jgi:hypothetical protein